MNLIQLNAQSITLADYHRLIEAGELEDQPVELLNGMLVEMSPEGSDHAQQSSDVADYLRDRLGKRAKIRDGHPVTLPNQSEPEPDIAVVQPLGREYRSHHPYPRNIFWLIEYANTSLSKDLQEKRQLYAAAGIPEYWVVNLRQQTLIVFRDPQAGDYQDQQELNSGAIAPLAFPDVSLLVSQVVTATD